MHQLVDCLHSFLRNFLGDDLWNVSLAFWKGFLRQRLGPRQFRLLKVLPATQLADDVYCEILYSSLDKHPEYEALSYAWGDVKKTSPIFVGNKQYPATTNLDCALRYIKLRDQDRILWVDSLCINQDDIEEKNHQVRQMRHIYTRARQVLVWLGEEEDANIALDHLKRLEKDTSNLECYKAPQEAWDACDALFYWRDWWTRTWILQEVIHERPVLVYMGHLTIELEDLCAKFNAYSKGSTSRVLGQRQLGTGKTVSERYSWLFKSSRMNSDSANVIQISRQKSKGGNLSIYCT